MNEKDRINEFVQKELVKDKTPSERDYEDALKALERTSQLLGISPNIQGEPEMDESHIIRGTD